MRLTSSVVCAGVHLIDQYQTALRRVDGDVHLAEDVSQQVFITLARNARSLVGHPALVGCLYVASRHAAANEAMNSDT